MIRADTRHERSGDARRIVRSSYRTLVLGVMIVQTLACAGLGPQSIAWNRSSYNSAIQQTSNQEMLLNIVRLRYRDTPFFLQVSGVASNLSTEVGFGGGAEIPSTGTTIGSVTGAALHRDNPTVTYSPLQGDQFVTQLLTPVRLETLLLLIESGWSIDRVLRLCAQRLNDAPNAPSASGPTPDLSPPFAEFRRASQLLRDLQRRDAISFAIESGDTPQLVMRFRDSEARSEEALELAMLLNLDPGAERYAFADNARQKRRGDQIAIETRSLMGSLFYLSQAVEPPRKHEEADWVTTTRNGDGSRFSWEPVMEGFFRVHSTPSTPSEAFLSTDYMGHTFSIDHRDLSSKATFALLNQLFALQAGADSVAAPLLTLPVSR